jgi:hypothetical protein
MPSASACCSKIENDIEVAAGLADELNMRARQRGIFNDQWQPRRPPARVPESPVVQAVGAALEPQVKANRPPAGVRLGLSRRNEIVSMSMAKSRASNMSLRVPKSVGKAHLRRAYLVSQVNSQAASASQFAPELRTEPMGERPRGVTIRGR